MQVRRAVVYPILAIAIASGFLFLIRSAQKFDGEEQGELATASTTGPSDRPRSEEAWTVLHVAQYLADFGSLAKGEVGVQSVLAAREFAKDGKPHYALSAGEIRGDVSIDSGVWNPDSYLSWAQLVLPPREGPQLEVAGWDTVKSLLEPGLSVFFQENRRISDAIMNQPGSGRAHARAALLVGTIALNEHAGHFRDARIALNRMTAHLVAAKVWGVDPTDPVYLLSDAIRLLLSGQQRDALALLDRWQAGGDLEAVYRTWITILRLRITCDWRGLEKSALAGPRGLQEEYFAAKARAFGGDVATEFLKKLAKVEDAGFYRIANENEISVSGGHAFSKPILGLELQEITTAAKAFGLKTSQANLKWLPEYLDTPEGSPVMAKVGGNGLAIEVAGRNLMAGHQQRQLMQGFAAHYEFLNDKWGVETQAKTLKEFVKKELPELRYKPFLVRKMARMRSEIEAANPPCARVIDEHPEWVTTPMWASLNRDRAGKEMGLSFPDFHAWFHPEVPAGTAYETGTRIYEIGVGDENDAAWLRILWERAPYDFELCWHNAWFENGRTFEGVSPEVASKWLGPLLEYRKNALWYLASSNEHDPELYETTITKIANEDPNYYCKLGYYFQQRGSAAKAAQYFGSAFEKASDRVYVANCAPWFVRYLYEHGEKDKARRVAKEAGEVYSYDGLAAYRWLMEAESNWEKALEISKNLDERYNEKEPYEHLAFLVRLNQTHPEKAEQLGYAKALKQIFPNGLQKAELKDFEGAPKMGVRFDGTSKAMGPFGLRNQMVIVALNSMRIENTRQYDVVRFSNDDPHMVLVVWDGERYRLCEGDLPGHRFGVSISDYRP